MEMRNIFKQGISHMKKYKGPVIQRTAVYLVKNQRNQKNHNFLKITVPSPSRGQLGAASHTPAGRGT